MPTCELILSSFPNASKYSYVELTTDFLPFPSSQSESYDLMIETRSSYAARGLATSPDIVSSPCPQIASALETRWRYQLLFDVSTLIEFAALLGVSCNRRHGSDNEVSNT